MSKTSERQPQHDKGDVNNGGKPGTEWTTGTAVTVDVPGTLLKSNSRRNAGVGNRRDASISRHT